ncbi:MAG: hypothetical protein D6B27_06665, partial [Gammaproteobacteria bacterium]
ITGETTRPAIYEIKNQKRISEILKLAGGLLPTSYTKLATIERINKKDNRTYVDINIRSKSGLNKRIYDGDIIKIFSVLDKVEDVVLIKGHVKRNLGLEWKHGMKISDILKNRDNLLPGYDSRYALIEREDQITKKLHVINFNIDKALLNDYKNDISLEKGDVIHIFALGQDRTKSLNSIIRKLNEQATHKQPAQTVSVKGNIRSPGDFPLYKGMTLQNLIFAAADLLPETDINYALIERKNPETQDSYIIQIDLSEESQNNFILKPLDKVIIFDLHSNRQSILAPIISKLESQATLNNKQRAISISGRVKFSGKYPYTEKMTLATLIDASGGYLDDVYLADAEIRRYKTINGERREISKLTVNLKNDLSRIKLKPYDEIIIRRIPDWTETESVKVVGEVKFPGTYTVSKSDTLWDVIKRAGGITEYADPNAAVFTRKTLKEKEQLELDRYRKQLDQLLASEQLESAKSLDKTLTPDTSVMDTDLANRIASTEAIGRLIIDMPKILNSNGAEGNVTLMEGDVLAIPRKRQDVSILGQVNFPTSHLYKEGYLLDDYISESGGFTAKADEDRIYVIKANGSVLATDRSSWFSQQSHEIAPGDTIVVPYDVDHVSPIIQWGNISRILFQLATTAATLKTVGVF